MWQRGPKTRIVNRERTMAFNWLEGILKSLMMCFGVETLRDNSSPMGSPMKSLSCPCTIFTPEDNSSSGCHKSSQDASDSPFRNTTQTLVCILIILTSASFIY